MKNYVVGFMFSDDCRQVALIRKNHPEWQAGKLNGIGGKIKEGELPIDAMWREFGEETGYKTNIRQWQTYGRMKGNNCGAEGPFECYLFCIWGDLDELSSPEEEKIEIIDTDEILPLAEQMIDNLPWLLLLAIDFMDDGRPSFVEIEYP
jgi:8-oxo-dGTP diphosphatase